jgi:hypothetical protein
MHSTQRLKGNTRKECKGVNEQRIALFKIAQNFFKPSIILCAFALHLPSRPLRELHFLSTKHLLRQYLHYIIFIIPSDWDFVFIDLNIGCSIGIDVIKVHDE